MAKESKFNLVSEPWIYTLDSKGKVYKEGLQDTFLHLQNRVGFGGEMRLQDLAILRLFVAASVTMIYREAEKRFNCKASDLEAGQLMTVYNEIWQNGQFPQDMVCGYFEKWYDRFWLIDEDHPFYQIPENKLKILTDKEKTRIILPGADGNEKAMSITENISAIVGTVCESGNKPAVFADMHGTAKTWLPFDETARWLVWYMSYAALSAKDSGKYNPLVRWETHRTFASLGTNIYPIGRNLFETVMLNSVLLNDTKYIYPEVKPAWEKEPEVLVENNPYGETFPNNLPELYTQQSRRIYILYDDANAISAYIAAGDEYGCHNAFIEPMFFWTEDKKADKSGIIKRPITIYSSGSKWDHVQNVLTSADSSRAAKWIHYLQDLEEYDFLEDWNIPFLMLGLEYGTMSSVISSYVTDSVSVNSAFFEDELRTEEMRNAIKKINDLSSAFYVLGKNLAEAEKAGEKYAGSRGNIVKAKFQNAAENLFQQYLNNHMTKDELYEALKDCGPSIVEEELGKTDVAGYIALSDDQMTVPKAINFFYSKFNKIFKKGGAK